MNPIALIPARGGSKGIPLKNLMTFCGMPLINWSIKQAREANLPVYVSTEDRAIAVCAVENDAQIIVRPEVLAQDNSTMKSVVEHAVDILKNDFHKEFDTVVLLQPTSPLRLSFQINHALQWYEKLKKKYAFSFHKAKFIEYHDFNILGNLQRQLIRPKMIEHGMLYIYDTYYLLKGSKDIVSKEIYTIETPRWQSFELDEPDDIDICEFYMRKYIL